MRVPLTCAVRAALRLSNLHAQSRSATGSLQQFSVLRELSVVRRVRHECPHAADDNNNGPAGSAVPF
jgi:hypothetical protein